MSPTSPDAKKPHGTPHDPHLSPGAAKLAAICARGTIAAVAAKLCVSEGAVRHWTGGGRTPLPAARSRALEVYGIALADWELPIVVGGATSSLPEPLASLPETPGAPSPPATPSLARAGLTSRQRQAELVQRIEASLAACDTTTPKNHLASLFAQLQVSVRHMARLDGDHELTTAAVMRSRAWAEIEAVLIGILRKYPGADAELVKALDAAKGRQS